MPVVEVGEDGVTFDCGGVSSVIAAAAALLAHEFGTAFEAPPSELTDSEGVRLPSLRARRAVAFRMAHAGGPLCGALSLDDRNMVPNFCCSKGRMASSCSNGTPSNRVIRARTGSS
jgi:hypothetical protein